MAETQHDPFIAVALVALATQRVTLLSGIVVAFARSPMTTAVSANDVQELSGGRFVLGLGAVCVPIKLGWWAEEAAYVLEHSGARGLVVSEALAERMVPATTTVTSIAEITVVGTRRRPAPFSGVRRASPSHPSPTSSRPAPTPSRRCWSTTGQLSPTSARAAPCPSPKGVVGNHTAIHVESLMMALEEGRFDADDRFVAMMPMFHTAQLNCHCTSSPASTRPASSI